VSQLEENPELHRQKGAAALAIGAAFPVAKSDAIQMRLEEYGVETLDAVDEFTRKSCTK
jgi:hypothetical protein